MRNVLENPGIFFRAWYCQHDSMVSRSKSSELEVIEGSGGRPVPKQASHPNRTL